MGSSSYRVVGCLLTLALFLALPTASANAQSNYQGDSSALPSASANLIDAASEEPRPVIVSSELLGEPYFRVVAVTVGSDLDAVRRVLPESLLVSTNADFLDSADDELYQLKLEWNLTKVNLDAGGVITLSSTQQLSD